ncbi:MAG: N-acetylmuramoyl-L-alanine amidase [Chitinophagaceae bacterium]
MMRRALFLFFSLSLSIILFSFTGHDSPLPKATVRTLIIDPGAHGTFSNEANVSLAVSLKFGKALEKEFPDLKIIYTRTTDVMPGNKRTKDEGLRYRADLANESGADLFIAIHCNAAGRHPGGWYEKVVVSRTPKTRYVKRKGKKVKQTYYVNKYQTVWRENAVRGTETYIWAVSKNDDKISSINKNDNTEDYGEIDSLSTLTLPDPSDPAEKARMLIYAQHYFRKSHELADLVEREFVSTGRSSRGVKQRNDKGIWVLQATGMPSILVEIGFISNKEEEEYINSDPGQEEIVSDLVNAFRAYKEKIEAKSISTSP